MLETQVIIMLRHVLVHWQPGNGIRINLYEFTLQSSQSTHLITHVRSHNIMKLHNQALQQTPKTLRLLVSAELFVRWPMKQSLVENREAIVDPTAAEALHALLRNTLADPVVKSLKERKISLVLSGGGGKGAYQAGAMLALYDCDIKNFSSIAGTSVGGLNAALCHELCRLGNRDLVLNMWGKITYKSVLALSFGLPTKLVLYALQSMRIFQ